MIAGRVLLAALVLVSAGPSRLKITLDKPDDRVEVLVRADEEVIEVNSKTGIGGLKIAPKEGVWPERVRVRLRLSGLEMLRLANKEAVIEGAATRQSEVRSDLTLKRDSGEETPLDPKGPYALEVRAFDKEGRPATRVPIADGWFEFTVPKALVGRDVKELTVAWVDFYR